MLNYGFCADEFRTLAVPHQLYVREARRMSAIMWYNNRLPGLRVANDIGSAVTRWIPQLPANRQNGVVKNEGDVQSATPCAARRGYRSIVPRVGECENACSVRALRRHIAFGSSAWNQSSWCRQSAATASAFAIDENVTVQQLDYKAEGPAYRGQATAHMGQHGYSRRCGQRDASGVTVTRSWTTSIHGRVLGANFIHDQNAGKGTKISLHAESADRGRLQFISAGRRPEPRDQRSCRCDSCRWRQRSR